MTRHQLSRRTFLKGCLAGATVSLGLPTFEAMLDDRGAFADGTQREPFFGLFYWANGTPWHAAHGQEQALAGTPTSGRLRLSDQVIRQVSSWPRWCPLT